MGDDITIGVTEITNLIEVTSQPNDQIIDIGVTDNTDNVTINVTPSVIEINIIKGNGVSATVSSVNGYVGDVVLTKTDLGLSNVDNTSDLNKPISTATQSALDLKVPYTGAISNVNLGEFQLLAGQITFDQTPTQTSGVGVLRWNDTDGTLDLGLKGGNVTLQLGQEQVVRIVNKTGVNLTEAGYQAVYTSGAQGQRLKVDLALANSDLTSNGTLGLVTENIIVNQEGFVTTNGLVRGINTTGSLQSETWVDGDILYLSPITAGRITNIKPIAPQHLVVIGVCVYAHITQGSIFVKVDNGYELDELHNVLISSLANNDVLVYESSSTLWKNKSISTVLGYTPANDANVVHLAGTETITGTKTFSASPLFDLGARYKTPTLGYQSINAFDTGWLFGVGAVTQSFLFSGATGYNYTFPNETGTIALTSNLSAYQPLLTNPITGTGTTNYLPKLTGASALGNSLIYDDGTNVGIGTEVVFPTSKATIQGNGIILALRNVSNGSTASPISRKISWSSSNNAERAYIDSPDALQNVNGASILFGTRNDSNILDERMRIASNGNVLIGTTTDNGNKLRVNGSGYFNGVVKTVTSTGEFLRNDASVAGASQVINIYNSAGTRRMLLGFGNTSSESLFFSNELNGDIIIRTNAVERLNVSSAGVVKINNLAGTGTRTVVADASGNLSTTVGYKVYTALVSQTGTSAPTAVVLENTTGATITFARIGGGMYTATFSSAVLTTNKTTMSISSTFTDTISSGGIGSTTIVNIYTTIVNPVYAFSDGRMSSSTFEVRIYN